MPAAVPEAGLVADQDLVGAERVPVRASRWRVGDPIPGGRLHQLAQHPNQPMRGLLSETGSRVLVTATGVKQRIPLTPFTV